MIKMKSALILLVVVLALCVCCTRSATDSTGTTSIGEFREQYRPQIHFSPKAAWMNDPNGMFFLDGEYHLFYQHYPDSTVWGPMHWGHAVTRDLVHWEHLPVALYPDSLGYIFSGSAVVDTQNTSGFGSKENPPVVAIFTYHDARGERAGRNDFQSQGLAYSIDKGRTWTKYDRNPVLKSPGIRDFRDPKVSWIDEAGQWIMTLAVTDHIEFYGSPDLKAWTKLSDFGRNDGDHGGVWECPDLFRLVDQNEESRYVLLVSINPGAPNGGSGTQYFIGDFDGKKFTSDTSPRNAGWIDYGTDNYAGVTWSGIESGDRRRVFIGWMSNWLYAEVVPTGAWRSAMTVPRTLTLERLEGRHILRSEPVGELDQLITRTAAIDSEEGAGAIELTPGDSFVLPLMIGGSMKKGDFALKISNGSSQVLEAGFNAATNTYYIDRGNLASAFHPEFGSRMTAPRNSTLDEITFVAVLDVASVELFYDDGATTMTAIAFPDEPFTTVTLDGRDGKVSVSHLLVQQLNPIW